MSPTHCSPSGGIRAGQDPRPSVPFFPPEVAAGRCIVCGGSLPVGAVTAAEGAECPHCHCSVRRVEAAGWENGVLLVRLPRRFRFPAGGEPWFPDLLGEDSLVPLLVLDVSHVEALSALAGRLARLNRVVSQRDGQMRVVVGPNGRQRQVLALLGLDHQLALCSDPEQALAGP